MESHRWGCRSTSVVQRFAIAAGTKARRRRQKPEDHNEDKLLAPVFNRSSRHPEGRGSCERLLLCTPRRVCGKMAREYLKLQQSLLFGSFEQQQGLMFRLGTFAVCTSLNIIISKNASKSQDESKAQVKQEFAWYRHIKQIS